MVNGKCGRFGVDNVGTTPAALSTYLAIMQMNPDLVINAGTAGGFKSKVIILLIRTHSTVIVLVLMAVIICVSFTLLIIRTRRI